MIEWLIIDCSSVGRWAQGRSPLILANSTRPPGCACPCWVPWPAAPETPGPQRWGPSSASHSRDLSPPGMRFQQVSLESTIPVLISLKANTATLSKGAVVAPPHNTKRLIFCHVAANVLIVKVRMAAWPWLDWSPAFWAGCWWGQLTLWHSCCWSTTCTWPTLSGPSSCTEAWPACWAPCWTLSLELTCSIQVATYLLCCYDVCLKHLTV